MARVYLDERESGAIKRRVYLDTPSPFTTGEVDVPEVKTSLGQKIKNFFTEDSSESAYDIFYQKKVDKRNLQTINTYSDAIKTLIERNKAESDEGIRKRREQQIEQLFKQQQEISREVGGELKDKSNAQLIGQSLGTALDLTPMLGFGGTAAKIAGKISQQGARVFSKTVMQKSVKDTFIGKSGKFLTKEFAQTAVKTSMVEGALFGSMVGIASELQEDEKTVGSVTKQALVGGAFGMVIGGALSKFLKYAGEKISPDVSKRAESKMKEIEEEVGGKVPEEYREVFKKEIAGGAPKEEVVSEFNKSKKELAVETMANTQSEPAIRASLEGLVEDADIPTVTRIIKNLENPNEIMRIVDEYNPEIQRTRLVEELSFADSDSKVNSLLKNRVDLDANPELSRILKNLESEESIRKVLDDYNVSTSPKEEPVVPDLTKSIKALEKEKEDIIKKAVASAEESIMKRYNYEKNWKKSYKAETGEDFSKDGLRESVLDALENGTSNFSDEYKAINGSIKSASKKNNTTANSSSIKNSSGKKITPEGSKAVSKKETSIEDVGTFDDNGEIPQNKETKKSFQEQVRERMVEEKQAEKSGASQRLLQKSVKEALQKEAENIPELKGMNMDDQAEKATRLLEEDYDSAIEIAMGRLDPPQGVKTGSVFVAVRKKAEQDGDIDMIKRLAFSEESMSYQKSLGQEIKAFDSRSAEDPVSIMKEIYRKQEELLNEQKIDFKKEKKKTYNEMAQSIEDSATTNPDPFIKEIKCK